jgi:hypothetical protein
MRIEETVRPASPIDPEAVQTVTGDGSRVRSRCTSESWFADRQRHPPAQPAYLGALVLRRGERIGRVNRHRLNLVPPPH